MRFLSVLVLSGLLAGCGADGEPVRPEKKSDAAIDLSVSGTAEIGIVR